MYCLRPFGLFGKYEDYENIEFEFYHYAQMLADVIIDFEMEKARLEIDKTNQFNQIRNLEKSDAATEKKVDAMLEDRIYLTKKTQLLIEGLKRRYWATNRIADSIKGKYIKETIDTRRQDMVENNPQQHREQ